MFITVTSEWARCHLRSPASRSFTQPFIQGADHRKHQSSASLPFVRGIHRWPANSLHQWPVTRTMFPFDDVIMLKRGSESESKSNTSGIAKSQIHHMIRSFLGFSSMTTSIVSLEVETMMIRNWKMNRIKHLAVDIVVSYHVHKHVLHS